MRVFARLFVITASVFALAAAALPAAAGDRISVSVRGHGQDVILIAGLASSGAVWDDLAARLQRHYRVHIVQIAGFAGLPAGDNAKGPVVGPVAEAIDRYIKAKGLKTPIIIGHSLGGFEALLLARNHPEDVSRLVLVDALPYFGVLLSPDATVKRVKFEAELGRMQMASATPAEWEKQETKTINGWVTDDANRKIALGWALNSSPEITAEALYDLFTLDLRPDLSSIHAPTLLLYPYEPGGKRKLEDVEALYAKSFAGMPHLTSKRIDHSRHFIPLDQPEVLANAVEAFLK